MGDEAGEDRTKSQRGQGRKEKKKWGGHTRRTSDVQQHVGVFVPICALHFQKRPPQLSLLTLHPGKEKTRVLTRSAARSFRPRPVRTTMSGIMLMYQGIEEIKGMACSSVEENTVSADNVNHLRLIFFH